jgi:integrase/recombinase XerC
MAPLRGIRCQGSTPITSSNAGVSVDTLMKLLGRESLVTSQRYVTAAGTETHTAAAQNRLSIYSRSLK